MTFFYNGLEYRIHFQHTTKAPSRHTLAWLERRQPHEVGGWTRVYADDNVVWGMATCRGGDNFNKEVGRKLALTRLLRGHNGDEYRFPVAFRTAVWKAYLGRPRVTQSHQETFARAHRQVLAGVI